LIGRAAPLVVESRVLLHLAAVAMGVLPRATPIHKPMVTQ
jgi:hypothetical protein